MIVTINGARSELGAVLARQRPGRGRGHVVIDVAGQRANTLLHDGHAWEGFARSVEAGAERALRLARTSEATMLVHASFAFVHAVERGAAVAEPLRTAVDAILAAEARILAGPRPACVVRLGYLYGPQSADLIAYRTAFRLGRPYWSGPSTAPQYHVHQFDAAAALFAAARSRNAGKVLYATDGHPHSFRTFMDAFAHRVGRRTPLHLPLFAKPLAKVIVREEHMQQAALAMPRRAPGPGVPGWTPEFPDYRVGLDRIIADWGG
jgi:hypothetical protein